MTDREQPQVFFIMLGIAALGKCDTLKLLLSLSLSLSHHRLSTVQRKDFCLKLDLITR